MRIIDNNKQDLTLEDQGTIPFIKFYMYNEEELKSGFPN